MLIPVLPLYARSFGVSYGVVGLVLAAQGIGNLLADVPSGMLMRKLGQRWSMLIGLGVLAISTIAMGVANTVPELIIYGLIGGVGMALWNISRHAYMTTTIPLHLRGRATATFGGINRIGVFAAPAVGGLVATLWGMRFPILLNGVLTLVAWVVIALYAVEEETPYAQEVKGLTGYVGELVTVFRGHYRVLASAGFATFLGSMIRSGRQVVIPLFAADVIGLDVGQIGLIVTISAAIDMSMFYPAGVIMDRFGRKFASVPSFAIQALGMALVPFTHSFVTLMLATLVVGFGNGIGSGTMLTLGSDLAPKDAMGEFIGMWRLIGDTGRTSAPLVVGRIADVMSLGAATFAIAAAGFGAAAVSHATGAGNATGARTSCSSRRLVGLSQGAIWGRQ